MRLNGVELRLSERFAVGRNARHQHGGAQVLFAVEQRALARPAQIGAEQDADAFEFPTKHDGVVVCFRKMVPRFGVEHEPRAESIAAIDREPVFRG